MLYLIGLGLGDATDITVKGLQAVRSCSRVYLEAYTSVLTVGKEALVSPVLIQTQAVRVQVSVQPQTDFSCHCVGFRGLLNQVAGEWISSGPSPRRQSCDGVTVEAHHHDNCVISLHVSPSRCALHCVVS